MQAVPADLQELRIRIEQSINQSLNRSANDIGIVETQVRHLQQRLAALQGGRTEAPHPEVSLRELQRQAITATQLHESLLQRQKELLLMSEDHPEVRILTFASVPNVPSSPNPILFILPALAVALIGAGLLAVLHDRLDRGLRSEQDVMALGTSCIGLVPRITRREKLRPHEHLLKQPFAPYTEAIRSAATAALQLTNPQEAPRAFLVTSSIRGEGKTTLALSFAVYAALLQRRVLLIDLDLRNPAMLSELKVAADKGTLDVLRSGRPLAELIRIVPELGLDYLHVRHDSADPIAVMANALPDLLRELKASYDCVVIDSAPLLGTSEARLLASMVDKVLFVVKWGSTRREIAQNALRLLDCSDSRDSVLQNRICAVVTQVDLKKHARYGFGDFGESLFYSKPYPAPSSRGSRNRSAARPKVR
jgi:Mrp family chromosome partitioning ATPase